MPLVPSATLLPAARAAHRGVGAFNVIQLEHAEALVAGAEAVSSPVILQISENAAVYHGALAPIGLATLAVARASSVPVVVHLDHATDEALIDEAIALGFTSVMFDASKLEYSANVARTAAVVARAHAAGVWVEAELGEVGGKDGVHAPGVRTDPGEAAAFVAATGVDALAVAVGIVARDDRADRNARSRPGGRDRRRRRRSAGPARIVRGAGRRASPGRHRWPDEDQHRDPPQHRADRRRCASSWPPTRPASIRAQYLGAGRTALAGEVTRLIGVLAG